MALLCYYDHTSGTIATLQHCHSCGGPALLWPHQHLKATVAILQFFTIVAGLLWYCHTSASRPQLSNYNIITAVTYPVGKVQCCHICAYNRTFINTDVTVKNTETIFILSLYLQRRLNCIMSHKMYYCSDDSWVDEVVYMTSPWPHMLEHMTSHIGAPWQVPRKACGQNIAQIQRSWAHSFLSNAIKTACVTRRMP